MDINFITSKVSLSQVTRVTSGTLIGVISACSVRVISRTTPHPIANLKSLCFVGAISSGVAALIDLLSKSIFESHLRSATKTESTGKWYGIRLGQITLNVLGGAAVGTLTAKLIGLPLSVHLFVLNIFSALPFQLAMPFYQSLEIEKRINSLWEQWKLEAIQSPQREQPAISISSSLEVNLKGSAETSEEGFHTIEKSDSSPRLGQPGQLPPSAPPSPVPSRNFLSKLLFSYV